MQKSVSQTLISYNFPSDSSAIGSITESVMSELSGFVQSEVLVALNASRVQFTKTKLDASKTPEIDESPLIQAIIEQLKGSIVQTIK